MPEQIMGAIDLQNRVVVPLEWQGVAPIVNPQLIWVKKDNLYYLYDGVQKSVRLKQGFANASNFDNEMAYVMSDGKWGLLIRMARYWCLACSKKRGYGLGQTIYVSGRQEELDRSRGSSSDCTF